jgi:hypothetical protein
MYWVYKERKINGWISYVITPIVIAAPIKTASFVVAIIGNVVVKIIVCLQLCDFLSSVVM